MNETKITDEFIREIPKTDLHVHLDGSLRIGTLIELAKKNRVELPSYTEEGLRELVFKNEYKDLGEYLHGFMYTCAVMRDLENIERISYELAVDNQEEGVRYVEVRFAPQLLMDNEDITAERVISAVNDGLSRAKKEFNNRESVRSGKEPPFDYGIIICAMRMFGRSNFSPYYTRFFSIHQYSKPMEVIKLGAFEIAAAAVKIRDSMGLPIVAIDLAGQEAGYPAEDFRDAYRFAHKRFLHKTVHAGEAYGAESIFQAITDLHADRLGHAYYLFDENKVENPKVVDKALYIKELVSYIAERRITVEVCLTSNLQTNFSLKNIADHSFKKMVDNRISVTICTDNRLVSNTSVSREIRLAVDNFDLTPNRLKNIVIYGFKRNFYAGSYIEKRKYVRGIIDYYDAVATKYNVPGKRLVEEDFD